MVSFTLWPFHPLRNSHTYPLHRAVGGPPEKFLTPCRWETLLLVAENWTLKPRSTTQYSSHYANWAILPAVKLIYFVYFLCLVLTVIVSQTEGLVPLLVQPSKSVQAVWHLTCILKVVDSNRVWKTATMRVFVILLSPSSQMLEKLLKLSHDRFLPNSFDFISHYSSHQSIFF